MTVLISFGDFFPFEMVVASPLQFAVTNFASFFFVTPTDPHCVGDSLVLALVNPLGSHPDWIFCPPWVPLFYVLAVAWQTFFRSNLVVTMLRNCFLLAYSTKGSFPVPGAPC